jgi:hypothetical protein
VPRRDSRQGQGQSLVVVRLGGIEARKGEAWRSHARWKARDRDREREREREREAGREEGGQEEEFRIGFRRAAEVY